MQPSYNVSYHLVDSSKYGVPQARKRLIIYGQRCSFTEIAEKSKKIDFFDHLKKLQESAPTTRQLFRDLPTLAAGQVINHYNKTHPTKFVSEHIRTDSLPLTWNLSRPNRQIDLAIYKIAAQKRARGEILKYNDLPSYLKTQHPEGFEDRFKAIPADDVSHTVVAHISKDGHYYIHPDANQNRSITVREAARIQTFPDNFYFMNSRTDAFKQIGNAVPPYLARKLADTILLQEKRFS
ncbi:cytosine-specific methyltransferase [Lacticaseibacillus casei A2-362]|nr:cytosine-specific methyltransferase [Lacticaseibacillus casei A2-362]